MFQKGKSAEKIVGTQGRVMGEKKRKNQRWGQPAKRKDFANCQMVRGKKWGSKKKRRLGRKKASTHETL